MNLIKYSLEFSITTANVLKLGILCPTFGSSEVYVWNENYLSREEQSIHIKHDLNFGWSDFLHPTMLGLGTIVTPIVCMWLAKGTWITPEVVCGY